MAKERPLLKGTGVSGAAVRRQITSTDIMRVPGGLSADPGFQSDGGIIFPGDFLEDTVRQGFLTPTGASLTGTMSTSAYPISGSNIALAIVAGYRVYKIAGDSTLSFAYTASRDTYDDIDSSGTITHTAVTNGAAAPSQAANTVRLQKVVTNGTAITAVTQLASTTVVIKGATSGETFNPLFLIGT